MRHSSIFHKNPSTQTAACGLPPSFTSTIRSGQFRRNKKYATVCEVSTELKKIKYPTSTKKEEKRRKKVAFTAGGWSSELPFLTVWGPLHHPKVIIFSNSVCSLSAEEPGGEASECGAEGTENKEREPPLGRKKLTEG
jgi:hypothetical protein